jgi:putative DNA primase/helicase
MDLPQDFIDYKTTHPEFFPADEPIERQLLFYQGFRARERERLKERVESVKQSAPKIEPEPAKRVKIDPVFGRFSLTDFGNAERLIAKTSGNIRYCPTNDSWYIWNGDGYWKKDDVSEIREYAKAVILAIQDEAKYADSDDIRTALKAWGRKCEKPDHVNAAIKLASSDPGVVLGIEKFDTDIYLFNFINGTYDLKNNLFCEHDRCNMITRQAAYDYNKDATCPMFLDFLERIFRGQRERDEIIRYLQKAIGYSLTGEVSHQAIFLLYGSGANGKSTLIETIRMLVGDYGTTIASASLTTQRSESVRNDIARLPKIRFVSASENAKGTVLDEELIKHLTGGDLITARFLFQEEFHFHPQLKLWWAFNHPPGVRDLTHSLMRRLKLIPFTETITDKERIDQQVLLEMFRQELPGIFNWALDGLRMFFKDGLKDPDTIKNAVKEFKDDQDILFDWLNDNCYVPARDALDETALTQDTRTLSSVLYKNYQNWAIQNHEKVMSPKKLGLELLERGFKREHTKKGAMYIGIGIK